MHIANHIITQEESSNHATWLDTSKTVLVGISRPFICNYCKVTLRGTKELCGPCRNLYERKFIRREDDRFVKSTEYQRSRTLSDESKSFGRLSSF